MDRITTRICGRCKHLDPVKTESEGGKIPDEHGICTLMGPNYGVTAYQSKCDDFEKHPAAASFRIVDIDDITRIRAYIEESSAIEQETEGK